MAGAFHRPGLGQSRPPPQTAFGGPARNSSMLQCCLWHPVRNVLSRAANPGHCSVPPPWGHWLQLGPLQHDHHPPPALRQPQPAAHLLSLRPAQKLSTPGTEMGFPRSRECKCTERAFPRFSVITISVSRNCFPDPSLGRKHFGDFLCR